jgi:hypothetical protein
LKVHLTVPKKGSYSPNKTKGTALWLLCKMPCSNGFLGNQLFDPFSVVSWCPSPKVIQMRVIFLSKETSAQLSDVVSSLYRTGHVLATYDSLLLSFFANTSQDRVFRSILGWLPLRLNFCLLLLLIV